MKISALTLSTVAVMALGVAAQTNSTGNSTAPAGTNTTAPAGTNTTAPGSNTTAPGSNSTAGNSTAGNSTSNTTSGAPKPTTSSAAFAIAAGSEGIVAAGVFAGLLAALV